MNFHKISDEIIREYDIRGIFGANLTEKDAYALGRKLAQARENFNLRGKICIARDGRVSSPALHEALLEGLKQTNTEIFDLGIVPTPALYFAAHHLQNIDIAVMITGSHNPAQHNGFKIVFRGLTLFGEHLREIANIHIEDQNNKQHTSLVISLSIATDYLSFASRLVPDHSTLKVVWDPGNGAACTVLQQLITQLPGTHTIINGNIDGTFPAHHPDPSKNANLAQLIESVKALDYDFGIAFDGDADRLGVVDKMGNIFSGGHLLYIFATDLMQRHQRPIVLADMKMGSLILQELRKIGCRVMQYKTGHALIKAKMKEINSLLAAEMSGHVFFGEDYYGFDDAIFGACKFLMIASSNYSICAKALKITQSVMPIEEIRLEADKTLKKNFINHVKNFFLMRGNKTDETDGVRVNFQTGWLLIRASNTENVIMLIGEAYNKNTYLEIKEIFDELILSKNLVE